MNNYNENEIVFGNKWFERHQSKLLWLLNTPLIKIWFRYKMRIRKFDCLLSTKINQITPNSFSYGAKYLENGDLELKTDFRTHDKYSKRLYFAFKPIWWAMHALDWIALDRVPELTKLSFGFSTLTVYPDAGTGGTTIDGNVERYGVNQTLSNIRSGAGTGADDVGTDDDVALLRASTTSNQYQRLARGIYTFDTSPLTSSATLSAVVFGSYGWDLVTSLGAFEVDVVASTPASNNALVSGDYSNLDSSVFASIASGSLNAVNGGGAGGYNDFTLDSNGIANVSKTGISKFGTRINWDTDNSMGGSWSSGASSYYNSYLADQSGTTNDPKLVITYTLPAIFVPKIIII
jgi:hypothetical protein